MALDFCKVLAETAITSGELNRLKIILNAMDFYKKNYGIEDENLNKAISLIRLKQEQHKKRYKEYYEELKEKESEMK